MGFWGKNKQADKKDEKVFKTEKNISDLLWIDYTNELVMVKTKVGMKPKHLAKFSEIESYSVFENGKELTKRSGVGRAMVGGALFGGTGAIVGALTGKEKDASYVNLLSVEIALRSNDNKKNVLNIPLITGKVKTNSVLYKEATRKVDEILIGLDSIVSE